MTLWTCVWCPLFDSQCRDMSSKLGYVSLMLDHRRQMSNEFSWILETWVTLLLFWLRFQKPVGLYFTFSQEIMTSGKQLKVVIYPKWRFTCITLFDVEVIFCCVIRNVATFIRTICFILIRSFIVSIMSVTGHWSEGALVRMVTGPKGHWSEGYGPYGVGIHCREVVRIEAQQSKHPLSVSQTIILVLHVSLSHTLILI